MADSPGVARRDVLRWALMAGVTAPALAGCGGFGSTGGSGRLVFLSTQFAAVEEAERMRKILSTVYSGGVDYVTMATYAEFSSKLRAELNAGKPSMSVVGGLHSDFVTFAPDGLQDLSALAARLAERGYPADLLELAKLGTSTPRYIPWAQATYVLAVNRKALEWLPSGVDVEALTYDQLLAWAKAAKAANGGKAVFGLPAGRRGLLHRFLQGFLLPSYSGGLVTTFTSRESVQAWEWLREFWENCNPASTNFDYMQDPLAANQVLVAWDHTARLLNAFRGAPDQFTAVPAPTGPRGRGYMGVVSGLAIPKGATDRAGAERLIEALSKPATQLEVLRQTAFFPTVRADIPPDLEPPIRLEVTAVNRQQNTPNALLSLPPVGLGTREGELTKIFLDAFERIVKNKESIPTVLAAQSEAMSRLLGETKAVCWTPDPSSAGRPCEVH